MKNAMRLLLAIGYLQDEYILDAHADRPKTLSRRKYLLIAAAAAAVLLLAGCTVYAWHWYTTFFTIQRREPLSDSQITYIQEKAEDIRESQTCDGYTVTLLSAISESHSAYVTFAVTAPEGVDLSSNLEDNQVHFRQLYAMPKDAKLPADMKFHIVEDGDGKNNTVNIVLGILPSGMLDADASFGSGSVWRIVMQGLEIVHYDREYEQELMNTKYAGVTDFMFEDEEAARLYQDELLTDGKWEFEMELQFTDDASVELLSGPIRMPAVVTRKERTDDMFYDTKDAVEEITVTSIKLHSLGATVTFEPPGAIEGTDCPDYFCTYMDMGDAYNPLTKLTDPEQQFFVMLKDGTRIDFWQTNGAIDTADLTADSPIVLEEAAYLQLSDGTRLEMP